MCRIIKCDCCWIVTSFQIFWPQWKHGLLNCFAIIVQCHFEQPSGLALLLVGIVAVSQREFSKYLFKAGDVVYTIILEQFPEVSILLQRHTTFFKDGDTIALSCDTNGSITGISWKKDSENLDNNINYTAFYSFTNSLLTIRSFRVALEGNYTCVATSDEGIVSSPSLWLQKTCKLDSIFGKYCLVNL